MAGEQGGGTGYPSHEPEEELKARLYMLCLPLAEGMLTAWNLWDYFMCPGHLDGDPWKH